MAEAKVAGHPPQLQAYVYNVQPKKGPAPGVSLFSGAFDVIRTAFNAFYFSARTLDYTLGLTLGVAYTAYKYSKFGVPEKSEADGMAGDFGCLPNKTAERIEVIAFDALQYPLAYVIDSYRDAKDPLFVLTDFSGAFCLLKGFSFGADWSERALVKLNPKNPKK